MSIANISNPTVAPQQVTLLIATGGSDGVLTMADTAGFYSGAQAFLSDNSTSKLCQITQIVSNTQLRIRFLNENGINQPQYGAGSNATAFITANGAKLTMPSQIVAADSRAAAVTSENELKVALGVAPGVSTDQGAPNTTANAWPIKLTDGTDTADVTAAGALKVDGSAVTQPVSGTVTVTGVATEATLSTINGKMSSFDLDNTGGVFQVLGVTIRTLSNGTPVQHGTVTDPFRVDPTGTTTQPVSSTQLPAALVGARLDINNGAWLGSTAPTVGSKTSANSIPVVIASDQGIPGTTNFGPSAVTVSNSAISILALNASRKSVIIVNNGTSNIYIGNSGSVTTSGANMGLKLTPGGIYSDDGNYCYTGALFAIGDAVAATQNLAISERT